MKVKKVLSVNAFCEKGTADKFMKVLTDMFDGKVGPDLSNMAPWGYRGNGIWIGEQPFRVEVSESIDDEKVVGRLHKKLAPAYQILGLQVDNLDEAIAEVRAKGLKISDKQKIPDPHFEGGGFWEAIISPKDAFGLYIELIEFKGKEPVYNW